MQKNTRQKPVSHQYGATGLTGLSDSVKDFKEWPQEEDGGTKVLNFPAGLRFSALLVTPHPSQLSMPDWLDWVDPLCGV